MHKFKQTLLIGGLAVGFTLASLFSSTISAAAFMTQAVSGPTSISGYDRYETAAQIAQKGWTGTSDYYPTDMIETDEGVQVTRSGGGSSGGRNNRGPNWLSGQTYVGSVRLMENGGTYGPNSGTFTIDGDMSINRGSSTSLTLQNVNVTGTLTLDPGAKGLVTLSNVQAGNVVVKSGASDSIELISVTITGTLTVNARGQTSPVHIVTSGTTSIGSTVVQSGANLENNSTDNAYGGISLNVSRKNQTVTFSGSTSIGSSITVAQTSQNLTLVTTGSAITGTITVNVPITIVANSPIANIQSAAIVTFQGSSTVSQCSTSANMSVASGVTIQTVTVSANISITGSGTVNQVGPTQGATGITVTFSRDIVVLNVDSITVDAPADSALYLAMKDANNVANSLNISDLGYASGDSAASVTKDLTLPTSIAGYENVMITWSSSNQSVIGNSGKVTRPSSQTDVNLTATIKATRTSGTTAISYSELKSFSVTVAATVPSDIVGPSQPTTGPGGSTYEYSSVMSETVGSGESEYIIFEPSQASGPLPVLAFIHGYSTAPSPDLNRDFIDHLVKKGNIVIWPYYQLPNNGSYAKVYDVNAGNAIKSALDNIIANPSRHAQPLYDLDGKMDFGILGHSAGGLTTANIASRYSDFGLPKPKAIMTMNSARGVTTNVAGIPYRDFSKIPSDTYMLTLVSNDDTNVGDTGSRYIWDHSTQITNKNWILVKSDSHGNPDSNDLIAAHNDVNNQALDAIDFYGAWKWATALFNYAFFGTDRDYCLGNTSDQRYMGLWSDGQAVIEPVISDNTPVWGYTVNSVTTFAAINVDNGTNLDALPLPNSVDVGLINGSSTSSISVGVNWGKISDPAYDESTAGAYTFTGTLTNLPFNVLNPNGLTASIIVNVATPSAFNITTESLPGGQVGTAYSAEIRASGGTGPYTFSLASGSILPAGLTLSSSGTISGSPLNTVTGAAFTVTATDSSNRTTSAALSLTVYYLLSIVDLYLPDNYRQYTYNNGISVIGGSGNYSYNVDLSSVPNLGYSSTTGVVSGNTAQTIAFGTYTIPATVTDNVTGYTTTTNGAIYLNVIDPNNFHNVILYAGNTSSGFTDYLPNAIVNVPYSFFLAPDGGRQTFFTYTFSAVSPDTTLPEWFNYDTGTGRIYGKPPSTTSVEFQVTVYDSKSNFTSLPKIFTLTVETQ